MPPEPRPPRRPAGPPAAWMEEVRSRLDALPAADDAETLADGRRRAGVLVPLYVREGGLWVLLTRRTESVERHRGQIAFPGGGQEAEDESLYATALRETQEEVGIDPGDVRYLGALSPVATVTDYYVEPYVAAIPHPYAFRIQESEIAELVEVPVAPLLAPNALETREFPGRPEPVLFYHHGETVIWGATARMLKELLDALGRS